MGRFPSPQFESTLTITLDRSILRAGDMRALEEEAFGAGLPVAALMEQAIQGCAAWISRHFPPKSASRVVVLAGTGHNGADGCGLARCLQLSGYKTHLAILGDPEHLSELTALQRNYALEVGTTGLPMGADCFKLAALCENADLIIDAMTGTGFEGQLRSPVADFVRDLSSQLEAKHRRGRHLGPSAAPGSTSLSTRVISIDLPTGLSADGNADPSDTLAIQADITLCLGAWKPVFFDDAFASYYGQVELVPLGLPALERKRCVGTVLDESEEMQGRESWPGSAYDHKYSRGHALIRAGGHDYPGAALLALAGAFAPRPGYVELVTDGSAVFDGGFPLESFPSTVRRGPEFFENMWSASTEDRPRAALVGPGCTSFSKSELEFVRSWKGPLVLDAGALKDPSMLSLLPHPEAAGLLAPRILTPHRGEFEFLWDWLKEKLAHQMGSECGTLASTDLLARAQAFSRKTGVHLLLKGASTLLASPQLPLRVWRSPEPLLAQAGTGDVLSGVLTGLLSRGLSAEQAMSLAVVTQSQAASRLKASTTTPPHHLSTAVALAAQVQLLLEA